MRGGKVYIKSKNGAAAARERETGGYTRAQLCGHFPFRQGPRSYADQERERETATSVIPLGVSHIYSLVGELLLLLKENYETMLWGRDNIIANCPYIGYIYICAVSAIL